MSNYIGSSKQKLGNKLIGLIVIVAMTFTSINLETVGVYNIKADENVTNIALTADWETLSPEYTDELGYGTVNQWTKVDGKLILANGSPGGLCISKGGTYRLSGRNSSGDIETAKTNIIVKSLDGKPINIILNNVNIEARGTANVSAYDSNYKVGIGAIDIQGNTVCNIILEDGSVNTLKGYTYNAKGDTIRNTAAISVENYYIDESNNALATVTINGQDKNTGYLTCTGAQCGAAIGGNDGRLTGNITINGGNITAYSGKWAAAIGDGDTIYKKWHNDGADVGNWYVNGENKNINCSKIEINGGNVYAMATTATPAIGCSDQLSTSQSGTEGLQWDGMKIEINGGTIIAVGGDIEDTAGVGSGNQTNLNPSNIIINQNGYTKMLVLTKQGGYPIINDTTNANAIPAISSESTATVIDLKFNSKRQANKIEFWELVHGEYIADGEVFPNRELAKLGDDLFTYGIAVVLPSNTYKIKDGENPDIDIVVPDGGGMIPGEEKTDGTVDIKYPPTITTPDSVVVEKGEDAKAEFIVNVTYDKNAASIKYQWQASKDGGNTWSDISADDSYSMENDTTGVKLNVKVGDSFEKDGYQYRCIINQTDTDGTVRTATSGPAALQIVDTTSELTANLKRNDELWQSSKFTINLYKDGVLYTTVSETNDSGEFKAKTSQGTFEIYVNGENTGITVESGSTVDVNFYDVDVELSGMMASDTVYIGAEAYNKDGTITIPVLKGRSLTFYATESNGVVMNNRKIYSVIYSFEKEVNGVMESIGKDNIKSCLIENGYKGDTVENKQKYKIIYKDKKNPIDANWRLITDATDDNVDDTALPVVFDDEQKDAKMCGNVWFYDNSAETFTSDVTGYRSSNTIVLNGDEGYFNQDSKIEISKGSREPVYGNEASNQDWQSASKITAFQGSVTIQSSIFAVSEQTTYFLLKVTNEGNTTYIPFCIVANTGDVDVYGFQINYSTDAGKPSEFCPSFRTILKASDVIEHNGELKKVVKRGTLFTLYKNKNSLSEMTLEGCEGDKYIGKLEATKDGIVTGNSLPNYEYTTYYCMTIKYMSYSYNSIVDDYMFRAYAVLSDGSVVYETPHDSEDANNSFSRTCPYKLAGLIYENDKASTVTTHEFLYNQILNIVAINENRSQICNAMLKAMGVTDKSNEGYALANQAYKDMLYYVNCTRSYTYSDRKPFECADSDINAKLLDKLNTSTNTEYSSLYQWIYDQVSKYTNKSGILYKGFYAKKDFKYNNILGR